MTKTGSVFTLLMILCLAAHAELAVDLKVGKKIVKLGEPVLLQVEIKGNERIRTVIPPKGDNFELASLGTSSNITIVNGVTSNSFSYNFYLYPKVQGLMSIPSFQINGDSGTYSTSTVEIEVVSNMTPAAQAASATAGAQTEENINFQVMPAKSKVFPNQPVILRYLVYSRVNFQNPQLLSEPDFSKVVSENFEQTGTKARVSINNSEYWEIELGRRIIYPISPGTFALTPAQLQVSVVAQRRQSGPSGFDDIFEDLDKMFNDSFFSPWTQLVPRRLSSAPVNIEVLPLPDEGRPSDFSNLVGEFQISAELDRAEVKAGDAINLSVTLKGKGNLKGFKLPADFGPDFQTYDSKNKLETEIIDGEVYSRLKYEYVLIPQKSGSQEVPPLSISFFNPYQAKYETVKTGTLYLNVSGKIAQSALVSSVPMTSEAPRNEIKVLEHDIAWIREKSELRNHVPAYASLARVALVFFLLLPFLSSFCHRIFFRYYGNRDWVARHKALEKALQEIAILEKSSSGNRKELYSGLNEIFGTFFRERFSFPNWAGKDQLEQLLSGVSIPSETRKKALKLYEELCQSAYAPETRNQNQLKLLSETRELLLKCNQ
ncbi:MAG: BatD family protein [Candidatus Wallbacteria bacterium]|nr:BatD family protein [Candidatus Wallbacteria bacterium]